MDYDCYLIDSYNMAYRQWWALKDMKYNGIHTGLEFGFIKKIVSYINAYKDKVYLAWDGAPIRCETLSENYKSTREDNKVNSNEPSWSPRLERVRLAFNNICKSLYHPEEEADEQIAKFVLKNKDKSILIVSNDKDMQQFISSRVNVLSGDSLINGEVCLNKWGIPSYKIPLYKSLDGDVSDNIPKVPRLLTATKLKLVNMSSNIDELIENFNSNELKEKEREKLNLYKEQVVNSYKMANLLNLEGDYNITLPNGDKSLLNQILIDLGLNSISLSGI